MRIKTGNTVAHPMAGCDDGSQKIDNGCGRHGDDTDERKCFYNVVMRCACVHYYYKLLLVDREPAAFSLTSIIMISIPYYINIDNTRVTSLRYMSQKSLSPVLLDRDKSKHRDRTMCDIVHAFACSHVNNI